MFYAIENFLFTNFNKILAWNPILPLRLNIEEKSNKISVINSPEENETERSLLFYTFFSWIVLFSVYSKCLNAYLRSLEYSFSWRKQFYISLWNLTINFTILLQFLFFWNFIIPPNLSVIGIKTFYTHSVSVLIFVNNCYLQGISRFALTFFIFFIPRTSLEPPLTNLLLLKLGDELILDTCRVTYLKNPKNIKNKFWIIRTFYLIYWIYVHLIFVPTNLFWYYDCTTLQEALYLLLWFSVTVFHFGYKYFQSTRLEKYLFPEPSQEVIRLTNFLLKYKKALEKPAVVKTPSVKQELWQTLICAMTMKKKINRLRKAKLQKENSPAKEMNISLQNSESESDSVNCEGGHLMEEEKDK